MNWTAYANRYPLEFAAFMVSKQSWFTEPIKHFQFTEIQKSISMNITGKLIVRKDTQKVSDSFSKREFVIEYLENPLYPQTIQFQLVQDRVSLLDPFSIGDNLEVEFNLKGRRWTSPQGEVKYFNSLEAWKIQKAENAAAMNVQAPLVEEGDDPSDLPF